MELKGDSEGNRCKSIQISVIQLESVKNQFKSVPIASNQFNSVEIS